MALLQRQRTYNKVGPIWWKNLRLNLTNPGIRSDHQITDLGRDLGGHAKHSRSVWLFASGASLQQYEAQLPELVRNDCVVVSPTTAPWFVYHAKRRPDVVFSMDVSPKMMIDCINAGLKGLPLVTPTMANNDLVRYFDPKVYWFNSLIQGPGGAYDTDPHSLHLMWLCDHIKYGIPQLGCVTNEAMVFLSLISHREVIGAERVVLAGADYSYWHDLARVPKGERDENNELKLGPYERWDQDSDNADIIDWRGMKSNSRMVQYTTGLVSGFRRTHMPVYELTGHNKSDGILGGIFTPTTAKQILADEWPELPDDEEINRRCDTYLTEEYPDNYPRAVGYSADEIAGGS